MNISPTKLEWRAEFKRLDGAYAKSTVKSYYVAVGIFVAGCEARSLQALPANAETISAFIEDQAKTCAISTIRNRLCAIRKIPGPPNQVYCGAAAHADRVARLRHNRAGL